MPVAHRMTLVWALAFRAEHLTVIGGIVSSLRLLARCSTSTVTLREISLARTSVSSQERGTLT